MNFKKPKLKLEVFLWLTVNCYVSYQNITVGLSWIYVMCCLRKTEMMGELKEFIIQIFVMIVAV